MIDAVLKGYAEAADALVARYETVSPNELYTPVLDLLPAAPARVLDVGAGTGRDAAWLAGQGHPVTAVEPVEAFRLAGRRLHPSAAIEWLDDRLPGLDRLRDRRAAYALLLLSGVWQHLDDHARGTALPRLADLAAPGSLLVISLRHGPGAEGRPVHEGRLDDTLALAGGCGFTLLRRRQAASRQAANRAAGVRRTWLAFARR